MQIKLTQRCLIKITSPLKGSATLTIIYVPTTPSQNVLITNCTSKKGFENDDRSHTNTCQGKGTFHAENNFSNFDNFNNFNNFNNLNAYNMCV